MALVICTALYLAYLRIFSISSGSGSSNCRRTSKNTVDA